MLKYFIIGFLSAFVMNGAAYGNNICLRTGAVRSSLEMQINKPCNQIAPADLAAIKTLNLSEAHLTALKADDFQGLTSLQTLYLSNNQITALPEGVFQGLTSLQELGLSNNQISVISKYVFSPLGFSSRATVDLKFNPLNSSTVAQLKEQLGDRFLF